jgi:hypothetical protein
LFTERISTTKRRLPTAAAARPKPVIEFMRPAIKIAGAYTTRSCGEAVLEETRAVYPRIFRAAEMSAKRVP